MSGLAINSLYNGYCLQNKQSLPHGKGPLIEYVNKSHLDDINNTLQKFYIVTPEMKAEFDEKRTIKNKRFILEQYAKNWEEIDQIRALNDEQVEEKIQVLQKQLNTNILREGLHKIKKMILGK